MNPKRELDESDFVPVYYDRKRRHLEGYARVMKIFHALGDGWFSCWVFFGDTIKAKRDVWFRQK